MQNITAKLSTLYANKYDIELSAHTLSNINIDRVSASVGDLAHIESYNNKYTITCLNTEHARLIGRHVEQMLKVDAHVRDYHVTVPRLLSVENRRLLVTPVKEAFHRSLLSL